MSLTFKLLSTNAKEPELDESMYYNLTSAREITIPAWSHERVPTDVAIQMPEGCYGRLAAAKTPLGLVGAGVIDPDYTGNIEVLLQNCSYNPCHIKIGQVIVRLICHKIAYNEILYTLHSENASPPKRMTPEAAGYDLYSAQDAITIPPWESATVSTDLSINKLPEECYGRLAMRSGTCSRHGLFLSNDVVIENEIINLDLMNLSNKHVEIKRGDRLVQLICEKILFCGVPIKASSFRETDRNDKGFGSTG